MCEEPLQIGSSRTRNCLSGKIDILKAAQCAASTAGFRGTDDRYNEGEFTLEERGFLCTTLRSKQVVDSGIDV